MLPQCEYLKILLDIKSAPRFLTNSHRITEWLRLERPSGSIWPNLHSRDSQRRVPRPKTRWLLKVSKEGTPQPLVSLCQCSVTAAWCSEGTFCVPIFTHCLLPCHRAPLRKAWLSTAPHSLVSAACLVRALNPFADVINENIKQYWSQHWPLEDTNHHWSLFWHWVIDHHSGFFPVDSSSSTEQSNH